MGEVQVKLFATLARYRPGRAARARLRRCRWSRGRTLRGVVAPLGLPDAAVQHVFVNGRRVAARLSSAPRRRSGDLPPLAGG